MNFASLLDVMERLLDTSHAAVLSTVDAQNAPHCRWMIPAVVRGRKGVLYAVTAPHFSKTDQLAAHENVAWLIQSKALDEIVEVRGRAQLVDNPALKSDVLEALGRNLSTFWRVNPDETELVVIETIIDHISYFRPMQGETVHAQAPQG